MLVILFLNCYDLKVEIGG